MTQGRPRFQFSLRVLFIVTAIAAVLVAGYVVINLAMHSFFHAILVGNTGPVPSPDDWPDPLKLLVNEPNGIDVDRSTIQVYCLCQGFDPEFIWRMDAAPGLFEHLKERWKLTPTDYANWPGPRGKSSRSGVATPPWWSPSVDDTTFFVCSRSLAGEKGDRFLVAFDRHRNTLFVHYWLNF